MNNNIEIQRIRIIYHEQLYANKWDNMEEMYTFLETYNLPKLNQEETGSLYRQIATNKVEVIIKKIPTNKSPGLDDFTGEFNQTFKNEQTELTRKIGQTHR